MKELLLNRAFKHGTAFTYKEARSQSPFPDQEIIYGKHSPRNEETASRRRAARKIGRRPSEVPQFIS